MSTYQSYANTTPQDSDVVCLSRPPYSAADFLSTTFVQVKTYIGAGFQPLNTYLTEIADSSPSSSGSFLYYSNADSQYQASTGILWNDTTNVLSITGNVNLGSGNIILNGSSSTGVFLGDVTAPVFIGALMGNATSATTSITATSAINFTGSLSGDVTGTQGATVVSLVGGSSASAVNAATVLANAATNLNTASTIVKRDASGNFSAGTITASLSGNATTATSATTAGTLTGSIGNNTFLGNLSGSAGAPTANAISTLLIPTFSTPVAQNVLFWSGTGNGISQDSNFQYTAGTVPHHLINGGFLDFGAVSQNKIISLFNAVGTPDQNQFYGFGISAGALRFNTYQTSGLFSFYASTSSTTSNLVAQITGTGNFSISGNTLSIAGTTNPALSFDSGQNIFASASGSGSYFSNAINNDAIIRTASTSNNVQIGAGTGASQLSVGTTVSVNCSNLNLVNSAFPCLNIGASQQISFGYVTTAGGYFTDSIIGDTCIIQTSTSNNILLGTGTSGAFHSAMKFTNGGIFIYDAITFSGIVNMNDGAIITSVPATVTTSTTITYAAEYWLVNNAASTPVTITLPALAGGVAGRHIRVIKIAPNSANLVTVAPNGADTILPTTVTTITTQYSYYHFINMVTYWQYAGTGG